MTHNDYLIGSVVRLSAAFTSAAGAAIDPATVTLKIKDPAGTITAYTYAAAQVVKDAVGSYHYDYTPVASGRYTYRWESAGAGQAAGEGVFDVLASRI